MTSNIKERDKVLLALNVNTPSKRKEILQRSGVKAISFSVLMKYLCDEGLASKLGHNEYRMTNSGELYAQRIRASYGGTSQETSTHRKTNAINNGEEPSQSNNGLDKELIALKRKYGKTALLDAVEKFKEWENE